MTFLGVILNMASSLNFFRMRYAYSSPVILGELIKSNSTSVECFWKIVRVF
jgi:hypothetical protein